jgi:hypothetical protein
MAKARLIMSIIDDSDTEYSCEPDIPTFVPDTETTDTTAFRVQVRQSPYIDAFHGHRPIRITIDSGATGNMIRASTARDLHATVTKSSQSAHQADGSSPLFVTGETRITFVRDNRRFLFEGLVVENLDVSILAGTPFMEHNDVGIRPAKRQVILGDGSVYDYGSNTNPAQSHKVRRAHVLRAPSNNTTVWPGDYIELEIPQEYSTIDTTYALEPRRDTPLNNTAKVANMWPSPDLITSVAGKIRIPNLTNTPQTLRRSEHFCQVRPIFIPAKTPEGSEPPRTPKPRGATSHHTDAIRVDPDDTFPTEIKAKFHSLLEE